MLKLRAVLLLAGLVISGCASQNAAPSSSTPARAAMENRVFELRTYITHEGKLDALQTRFRDHTMRLFEKHGMTNIVYWVPEDTALAKNRLMYLLAYPDRESARRSWQAFGADPEWRRVRAESEAAGPIVQRVESVFLNPVDYSPMK